MCLVDFNDVNNKYEQFYAWELMLSMGTSTCIFQVTRRTYYFSFKREFCIYIVSYFLRTLMSLKMMWYLCKKINIVFVGITISLNRLV